MTEDGMTTIQRAAGIPGSIDLTDAEVATRFDQRVGRCYEIAARYLSGTSGAATLVHGTIQGEERPPLGHAWVELADGDVFEPTSGHRMSGPEFAAYFRPTVRIRYSKERVYVEMLRHETYGPWEEER